MLNRCRPWCIPTFYTCASCVIHSSLVPIQDVLDDATGMHPLGAVGMGGGSVPFSPHNRVACFVRGVFFVFMFLDPAVPLRLLREVCGYSRAWFFLDNV